jgi:glycosyltransferase involved in cell wall biosynthesis
MNILILSSFFPFPLTQGGKIRVFNIIKYLSRTHKVTLACLSDAAVSDYGPLKEYCEEVIVVVRRPNVVNDFFSFLFSSKPYNFVVNSSRSMRNELQGVLERKSFELIQIEFSTMWQYADIFKGIPVVLDAHNIEADIIRQVREFYKNPLRKLLYSLEEKKLRKKEEQAWKDCSICYTVSEHERTVIAASLGQSNKVVAIPNGVDLERFAFSPKAGMDNRLLLLGGMRYQPNLDSALYLLNDIMPEIQARIPGVKIDIAGRELWRIKDHAAYGGVEFHEDVSDVLPFFRQSDVLLVPLRYGAGTRIKILEAMAAGLPVVTTPKGCEGIEVRHGEHLMIADTPDEFASAVKRVLDEADLRTSLSRNARKLVEEKYSWEGLIGEMAKRVNGVTLQSAERKAQRV